MEIIGIPYGAGAKVQGCQKAPKTIFKQLEDIWTTEQGEKFEFKPKLIELDQDYKNDFGKIGKLKGNFFVGGDHSITYPLFKSFVKDKKNTGLLVFDAHPDCFKSFEFPSHGDWLYYLIEEKIVPGENVTLVGIRNPSKNELEFIKKHKINVIFMKNIIFNINDVCDSIMEYCRKYKDLYLSLDVDVLDPAFAPGTGFLEPGGLSSREMIYILQRIRHLNNIKRFDLVEVNPTLDLNDSTSKLAARLIAEIVK